MIRWAPPSLLLLTAGALGLLWDRLPARWATHWNVHDVADGFAERNFMGVFGPLMLGMVMIGIVEATNRLNRKAGPASLEAGSWLQLGMATLFSGLSLGLPLLQPPSSLWIVLFALVTIAGALAMAARSALKMPTKDGYNGVFYVNAADPRIWVPKRIGVGWTLNFAHRLSFLILLALVVVPLGSIAALRLLVH